MKLVELERKSADDLWKLHVEIGEALAARLTAEKDLLEERLKQPAAKPHAERRVATSERRHTRQSFQNSAIRMTLQKRGPGGQAATLACEATQVGKKVDEFKIEMVAE